jgi:hypothetical protein
VGRANEIDPLVAETANKTAKGAVFAELHFVQQKRTESGGEDRILDHVDVMHLDKIVVLDDDREEDVGEQHEDDHDKRPDGQERSNTIEAIQSKQYNRSDTMRQSGHTIEATQ